MSMFVRVPLLLPKNFARQLFLAVNKHIYFSCADSATGHARNIEPRSDVQGCYRVLKQLRGYSHVHERAQKHIATHAGETVEIGNARSEEHTSELQSL